MAALTGFLAGFGFATLTGTAAFFTGVDFAAAAAPRPTAATLPVANGVIGFAAGFAVGFAAGFVAGLLTGFRLATGLAFTALTGAVLLTGVGFMFVGRRVPIR